MLKITTVEAQGKRMLILEGKLIDPWVEELEKAWGEERRFHKGSTLVIDIRGVTVISKGGESILLEMMTDGAQFSSSGVFNTHVLDQLRCTWKPKGAAELNDPKK